ncbi:IS21-like element helper ATPase IstB [Duganella sp. HH101]|uniref:IS21-like element helper ATPase IstB n=1 Tax=Duganella sp. HH101 TaxID=1781066 RepID=UPI000893C242|nr:IS21-like element helper ATPase IstB [Duganella sp. HH101]OFA03716.1 transposase [Duganella sp. HH101]
MMNNPTIDKLNDLRLPGMAAEFERQLTNPSANDVPFEHRVRSMVDHETTLRDNKRLQYLLKKARLPISSACIEDIDYRSPRGLDKSAMLSITSLDWVRSGYNVVMTGPSGTGKTWLANALGNHACRLGLSCFFTRVPALTEDLFAAHATGTFNQTLEKLKKFDLLILDDWGIQPFPERAQNDLLELIDSRIGTKSLIITSQLPMELWHGLMDSKTVADAVMDRVIHTSYHMPLSGETMRRHNAPGTKKEGRPAARAKK